MVEKQCFENKNCEGNRGKKSLVLYGIDLRCLAVIIDKKSIILTSNLSNLNLGSTGGLSVENQANQLSSCNICNF